MPFGKIHDVDIVAHTGTVGRRVIVAEHAQTVTLSGGHLCHVGQQIVGNAARCFTDQPAFMGTHRVEIAQAGDFPGGIGFGEIGKNILDH